MRMHTAQSCAHAYGLDRRERIDREVFKAGACADVFCGGGSRRSLPAYAYGSK